MYTKEMFIKYIKADDKGRILISVQNHFKEQLKREDVRKEIKNMLKEFLKDNFEKLEIGKNICRVTVNGNTDEAINTLESKIEQTLQMAGEMMDQMAKNNE